MKVFEWIKTRLKRGALIWFLLLLVTWVTNSFNLAIFTSIVSFASAVAFLSSVIRLLVYIMALGIIATLVVDKVE